MCSLNLANLTITLQFPSIAFWWFIRKTDLFFCFVYFERNETIKVPRRAFPPASVRGAELGPAAGERSAWDLTDPDQQLRSSGGSPPVWSGLVWLLSPVASVLQEATCSRQEKINTISGKCLYQMQISPFKNDTISIILHNYVYICLLELAFDRHQIKRCSALLRRASIINLALIFFENHEMHFVRFSRNINLS